MVSLLRPPVAHVEPDASAESADARHPEASGGSTSAARSDAEHVGAAPTIVSSETSTVVTEAHAEETVKTAVSSGTASDTATPTASESASMAHTVPTIPSPTSTSKIVSVLLSKKAQKKLRKQQAAAAATATTNATSTSVASGPSSAAPTITAATPPTRTAASALKAMETVSAALGITSTSGGVKSTPTVQIAAAAVMSSAEAPYTTVLDTASTRSVDRAMDAVSGALNVARANGSDSELSATPQLVALPNTVLVTAPLPAVTPSPLVPASLPTSEKKVVVTTPPLSTKRRKEIKRLLMSRDGRKKSLNEAKRILSLAAEPKVSHFTPMRFEPQLNASVYSSLSQSGEPRS